MKKTAYILALAALIAAGCVKDPAAPSEDSVQTTTLTFTPEFEMDVEVKSAELGKDDIWCFLYDWNTKTYSEPFKQAEINGTSYLYTIPKKDNLYAMFVLVPAGYDINSLTWAHYNEYCMGIEENILTTEPLEIYMTGFKYYYGADTYLGHDFFSGQYQGITFNNSGAASISLEMSRAVRKETIKFRLVDAPEGVTIESLIRKIHVTTKTGTQFGCSFGMDEMYDETDDSETPAAVWKCADLYFNREQVEMDSTDNPVSITIETTDNKIFSNTENGITFGYYYSVMTNSFNINYSILKQ